MLKERGIGGWERMGRGSKLESPIGCGGCFFRRHRTRITPSSINSKESVCNTTCPCPAAPSSVRSGFRPPLCRPATPIPTIVVATFIVLVAIAPCLRHRRYPSCPHLTFHRPCVNPSVPSIRPSAPSSVQSSVRQYADPRHPCPRCPNPHRCRPPSSPP